MAVGRPRPAAVLTVSRYGIEQFVLKVIPRNLATAFVDGAPGSSTAPATTVTA
jgi:hypothetical protein